ncbi:response regulator [Curvivirga aplysinae]|uniref:response regulator n=1 Tax=Curvivirga aplysinae TaxID=2529852 RepID=UPI0012BD2096|nr:response regulator [Curvivirga aplysinae]MTI10984.1 response regulator [Curvivirga aplysinae]
MTDSKHVLVVDDHRDIREPLVRYLSQNGFRTSDAEDATTARQILNGNSIDLVVLDIMMPGEDGLSLCRHIQATSEIPVILLTAMVDDTDRIIGLEMGADDYVTKPFNPRELIARIKAVLRRTEALPPKTVQAAEGPEIFQFADWKLDSTKRALIDTNDVTHPLSTAEYDLLYVFVTHPNMVLSRDQLLDLARGRDAIPFDRSVDNQISRLRKKLEKDPKNPELLTTVWGGGYMLTSKVDTL